jgi:hypothetical protein
MDPDFLWSLLESMILMRLSVKKAAYADLSRAAHRKSGGILGALLLHTNALVPTNQPYLQFRAEAFNLLNRVQFALRLSFKGQVTWETRKQIREQT